MNATPSTFLAADPDQPPALRPSARPRDSKPLRFITCGGVDDGKSTLIGRLLWDTKAVPTDHIAGPVAKGRTADGVALPDFAMLLDGLQAEREQGITIDVAYRYFATPKRSFIVADTPGHEEYTRNMATGASTADLALLLIDARAGLLEQTRRHATIVSLMGISSVVLVVNKIDLVGYDQARFDALASEFKDFALSLGLQDVTILPTSAIMGENVVEPAPRTMPWYEGPTLLELLERAPTRPVQSVGFRFPVQRVCRPDEGFRGYQGTVAGGSLSMGDGVVILPSGERAVVDAIVTADGTVGRADTGDAVTLVLDRQVDVARGDMVASFASRPQTGRIFDANLIALSASGIAHGQRYLLKAGSRSQHVTVTPHATLDLTDNRWVDGNALGLNGIGRVALQFEEDAIFDAYEANRSTGSFILIHLETNETVAGGMISSARTENTIMTSFRETGSDEDVVLIMPHGVARAILASPLLIEHRDSVRLFNSDPHSR